jgi:uncharacterized protein (TIGR03435 family)
MPFRMSLAMATAVAISVCVPAIGAQSPVTFEVASIRPSAEGLPAPGAAGVHITQRQFRAGYLSLRDYLGIAYKMRPFQLVAPDWVASARFDIVATLPEGVPGDRLGEMMQSLLALRFGLRAHRDHRDFDVYALGVNRSGPPLVRVPDDAPTNAPFTVAASVSGTDIDADLGNGATLSFGNGKFAAKRVTMAVLADTLGRFMDRPIVDQTQLEGRYDVVFDVAADDVMPMLIRSGVNAGIQLPPQALQLLEAPSTGSVPDALRRIGLSLERRRAPLEVLVVDSMQRTPTEN